ncbi:MAG: hypothetical protein ABFS32_23565 [Bacteroidota bacterium]
MQCSSGKNSYYTEDEAQEALIRSQIRFSKSAINYYYCIDCGQYHLTSTGPPSIILNDPEIIKRIEKEKQAQDWENRLR